MIFRLFFNAETQRRGDAENNPCVSAPLRLCVKNFSFLPPPSLLRPLHGRNKAFTLIETALAMLAIGLGLLAIFGLGRLSLQAAKETEHDQRCVMMADAVFETLREYNARFVDEARTNGVPNTWENLWEKVALNQSQVPFPETAYMSDKIPPMHFWQDDERASFDQGLKAPTPAFDPDNIRLSDWNPRYILYISDADTSPVAQAINVLQFTLMIFPDGDTYSSDPRIFSTTLTNPGGLP